MTQSERIDYLEQQLDCLQGNTSWMPEAIMHNKREISRLQERIAALEEKLCISELEAGAFD